MEQLPVIETVIEELARNAGSKIDETNKINQSKNSKFLILQYLCIV